MRILSLEKSSKINLIVVEDKKFVVRHYEISFSMLTRSGADEKEMDELQLEQNISFAKVMCFIDAILNNSILITTESLPYYEKTLCEFGNNYVLVPDVADNIVIGVIMSKMNAISGENTEVNSITLFDLDEQLKYKLEIYEDDDESDLPDIKTWLGNFALSDTAWWSRSDETTWDGVAKTQDEYDNVKTSVIKDGDEVDEEYSIFDDIEESIRSLYKTVKMAADPESTAEVIEVDFAQETKKKKWKPKLI